MNRTVSLLLACAGGVAIAVQARLTGALKQEVGDGTIAAAVTFGTGLVFMLVVTLATRANRRALGDMFTAVARRRFPAVFLLTGLSGGYAVFTQGATVDLIGVAVFSLTFIAGQILASIALDALGWVPAGRRRMTRARTLGTTIAVAGIALAIVPRTLATPGGDGAAGVSGAFLGALALVFCAGLLQPGQMAMNGVVGAVVIRPEPIAFVNYVAGTALLVVIAWPAIAAGALTRLPTGWDNLWYYIGGFLGSVVVIGGTLLTRTIGSLMFTLGVVAGQIAGAIVIDAFWPVAGSVVGVLTITGGALTIIALAIASGRGAGQPPRGSRGSV